MLQVFFLACRFNTEMVLSIDECYAEMNLETINFIPTWVNLVAAMQSLIPYRRSR